MLAVLLWSLANCLLGYFAFRVLLVVNAVIAGAILGQTICDALISQANFLDYLVACGGLGAGGAICGWFLPRLALAGVGGLAVGAGTFLLAGQQPGVGLSVLAVIVAIATGVVCYIHPKRMALYLAGVIGAICTIFASASLLGWTDSPGLALISLLVLLATGLAVVGIHCQVFLARRLTYRLSPQAPRRCVSKSDGQVHPRFTKI